MNAGSKSEIILDNKQKMILGRLQEAAASIEPVTFVAKIRSLFFKSKHTTATIPKRVCTC